MKDEFACLGVKWLGQCSYMMHDPQQIYLAVGHLLPPLMLLLVFFNILTPGSRFRLNTKSFNIKKAVKYYISAVICVFIAALVTLLPFPRIPVVGYSIVWELLGGALFITATLRLMATIYKPALFTRQNFKTYFRHCLSILESEKNEELQFLAEELAYSIPAIIAAIKEHSKLPSSEAHKNKYGKYAALLLNILSSEKFCKFMVLNAPSTPVKLLEQITAQKLYHEGAEGFVHAILTQAFIQQDSVLHADTLEKRIDYTGYSSRSKFFRYTFRNLDFLDSHFDPLHSWHHESDTDIAPWKIQRYFTVFRAAIETYFGAGQFQQFSGYLQTGFNVLTSVAKGEVLRLQSSSKTDIAQSETYQNLRHIGLGYIELIRVVKAYHDKLPEYAFHPKKHLSTNDPSIYNLLANALFDYLCDLSLYLNHDETVRKLAMIVWEPLFMAGSKRETKVLFEIQQRLSLRILRRLRRDMRVDYPPYLLRLVLNITGLNKEEKPTFKTQVLEVVQENFVKRVEHRNDAWLAHLLPSRMGYDAASKEIIETLAEEKEVRLKVD